MFEERNGKSICTNLLLENIENPITEHSLVIFFKREPYNVASSKNDESNYVAKRINNIFMLCDSYQNWGFLYLTSTTI